MSKLKVGDEVVCTNSDDTNYLNCGDLYSIKSIEHNGTHLVLDGRFYRGGDSTYSINRFKKVEIK